MDYVKVSCRLCLKENGLNLLPIIDEVPEKLKVCTSLDIQTNKDFPMTICESCSEILNEMWNFRNMCLESDRILKETRVNMTLNQIATNLGAEDGNVLSHIQILCSNHTYHCEICQQNFNYLFEYLDHQLIHNGSPVFKCDKCNEILSTREELVLHDNNHKVSCPDCGKIMKKSSLQLHLISHTDKFKCSECSQTCSSKTALEQHKITVHTDIKSYVCENCGKNFSTYSSLRTHLLSHSQERRYKCKFCEYAGRTSSAIYIHMAKHAQDKCVCEVCSKEFKSNRNLSDHRRRAHSENKKHICSYCTRQFVDHYMLKIHLRIHSGLRPYKCEHCNKSFFRADGLKEHTLIHQPKVLHKCEKCLKQYTSKRGISRHNCLLPK